MSRTFRKNPHGADDLAEWYQEGGKGRKAARINAKADGAYPHNQKRFARPLEGKYQNTFDDCSPSYGKKMGHRDIRRHNKALVKAGLKENDDV